LRFADEKRSGGQAGRLTLREARKKCARQEYPIHQLAGPEKRRDENEKTDSINQV
jgi:hypothetical protein